MDYPKLIDNWICMHVGYSIYLFISQYFTRVAHTTKVGFQWGPGLKTEYIHNTTIFTKV